jgi:HSP20 family protein
MPRKFNLDPREDFKNYQAAMRQTLQNGVVLPRDLMPSPMNAIVIPVDVLDNGTEIMVKANLPGVRPEDVSITVLKGTLTIKAEMQDESDTRGAIYLRRERKITSFTRSLSLPSPVNVEKAEAKYKNGVLTLILPKSNRFQTQVISTRPG